MVTYILRLFLLFIFFTLVIPSSTKAQDASRLVFCTQNLHQYGMPEKLRTSKKQPKKGASQKTQLASRMKQAECDLIAVQELYGETERYSKNILLQIGEELNRDGRKFSAYVGYSRDPKFIRNGFLIDESRFDVLKVNSFQRVVIPRLKLIGRPAYFDRNPLALFLSTKNGGSKRYFFVIVAHLKSKANSWKDPSGTQFEALRLQLAESIKLLAEKELKSLPKGTHTIVLLDRNSDPDSASAAVLEGVLSIEDFRNAKCRITKSLTYDCKDTVERERLFIPLLARKWRELGRPEWFGSYRYRGRVEIIDEILLGSSFYSKAHDAKGQLDVGTVGEFNDGSDHRLVWIGLN